MTHWATPYLGIPWIAGESDCWNFARRVWREQFGLEVAAIPFDGTLRASLDGFGRHVELAAWNPVQHPTEGDAVLMARRRPSHVGICLNLVDGPAVLHSLEGTGVVITALSRLSEIRFSVAGYYRRAQP